MLPGKAKLGGNVFERSFDETRGQSAYTVSPGGVATRRVEVDEEDLRKRLRAGEFVRARESSSDLVQSVCREVLANIGRFQHPSESAFKQWLFREALRKIVDRRDYWLAEKREVLREVPVTDGSGTRALRASRQLGSSCKS